MSRRSLLIAIGVAAAASPLAGLAFAGPALAEPGPTTKSRPRNIPVFAYHQLDNTPDVESISSQMFGANMAYLHGQGYQTITADQYSAWVQGRTVSLPAKPMLITVDDGIINFFGPATPILQQYGFTAVAFIVTAFADGAGSGNPLNVGWNMSWPELRALPSAVWEFAFHAGAQGHSLQTYDPVNPFFYAARMPGETDTHYRERVSSEIAAGRRELDWMLRTKRINHSVWAAPWNDAGQPGQVYSGPIGWLEHWASSTFPVVFLQDSARNGVMSERYRFEVQSWMTEPYFEQTLATSIDAGYFDQAAAGARAAESRD